MNQTAYRKDRAVNYCAVVYIALLIYTKIGIILWIVDNRNLLIEAYENTMLLNTLLIASGLGCSDGLAINKRKV